MASKFTCCECGHIFPASSLSTFSLSLVDTTSKARAIGLLSDRDIICVHCDDYDPDDYTLPGDMVARTEYERFAFSGVTLDPAKFQAYRLSN